MTRLRVSYLGLTAPPLPCAKAPALAAVINRERLDPESYLALYRAVGEPWRWDERVRMPRDQLDRHLRSKACDIFVARRVSGNEALGFCEFDSTGLPAIQLVNFGLIPAAQGQGLGPHLLHEALGAIWHQRRPARIWLHTDEWDHPGAVAVYRRAGFTLEKQTYEDAADL
jgi:ribosomal protein S18 acetylase RimI-like enzyme